MFSNSIDCEVLGQGEMSFKKVSESYSNNQFL
jgi:hypothetical protein